MSSAPYLYGRGSAPKALMGSQSGPQGHGHGPPHSGHGPSGHGHGHGHGPPQSQQGKTMMHSTYKTFVSGIIFTINL